MSRVRCFFFLAYVLLLASAGNADAYTASRVNFARYQAVTTDSTNGSYAAKYSTDGMVTDTSCWQSDNTGPLVGSFAVTNGLPAGYYIDYAYNSGKTIAVVSAASDSDGDGIPNGWEIARGLNPYNSGDANIDTDTDKLTSRQEYWSGTDPQDSNSFFRIDSLSFEGSNLVLRWRHAAVDPVIPPISIQSRTNMVTGRWTNLGQKAPVDGTNVWNVPLPVGEYLRLCVTNMP